MRVVCLWFKSKTATLRVAEACLRFSPQICMRDGEAVFIEIGKCHRLYSEDGFRARIQVVLRRLGLEASIAIADDIPQALLRAKYNRYDVESLPLTALIEVADPFNKDYIGQKYVNKMILAFTDLGIKTLGQFKKIPMADLTSRFGAIGILCRERALSAKNMPWPLWKPEEIIQEKSEFPYFEFYGELEPLLFELKKQLDSIFQRLLARGLKAQQINVQIFFETNSYNPKGVRDFHFDFLYPQNATKGTLTVIRERLTREFQKNPVRTTIQGLQTTIVKAVPGSVGQKNIFHNQEEVREQLHTLLNQLSETHGSENIFQAELTEDRRPEKSWRKVDTRKPNSVVAKNTAIQNRIPQRPTYLMTPELVQIQEGFIFIRRQRFRIVKKDNQIERISGGWFEYAADLQDSYDRTYFHLELENGQRVAVFENRQKQIFLHGYYG